MSFRSDVTRFNGKARSNMDLVVKRATFELSKMLVFKTAVDTGLLRSNWQISENEVPAGSLGIGTSPALAQSQALTAGNIAWVTNNLPYAMAIMEFGHSRQTPTAAARASVMQIQGMVRTFCKGLA